MYDRILCPTDGSAGATSALDRAIDLAVRYDAALHVLYVVEETMPVLDAADPELGVKLREHGDRVLTKAADRAVADGVDDVERAVVGGTPHRRILAYADEHDADLIIMGTDGRTGLDRFLLGSVAERVLRLSDVPVLTVRRDDRASAAAESPGETDGPS